MDNISDLLGGVLSNPEMLDKVRTMMPLVSQMLKNNPAEAPQQTVPAGQVNQTGQDNILADESVAAAVQNLIEAINAASQPNQASQPVQDAIPVLAQIQPPPAEPEPVKSDAINIEKTLNTLKSATAVASPENDHRAKLLLSLKPFLGESRRTKIDTAIKYINAAKIFSMFGKNGFV
jgi:hydroxypyruvate isomerase